MCQGASGETGAMLARLPCLALFSTAPFAFFNSGGCDDVWSMKPYLKAVVACQHRQGRPDCCEIPLGFVLLCRLPCSARPEDTPAGEGSQQAAERSGARRASQVRGSDVHASMLH